MDAFLNDLRYAARTLRKNPRFTLLVTTTLALGIGANTAVFGLVDAWLLRPLRFHDPGRLVIVLESYVKRPTEPAIFPLYRDVIAWEQESRSFDEMAGVFWRRYLLTGHGDSEQVSGMIVTAELFDTLGVAPLAGRTFNRGDLNGPPRVVLGHAFWLRLMQGSPDVVGASLTLNGRPHEVVGVMPRDFDFRILDQPSAALWTLLQPGEANYGAQSMGALAVIGRLKPNVTASAAQAELLAIQERIERQFAERLREHVPLVTNLQADNTRTVSATLLTLTTAVGFVLLIACTNIATLLIGRGVLRQKEFAVRAALGSGRARLVRQVLSESLVLSAMGMLVGLVLARVALDAFVASDPIGTLPPQPIGVDVRVFAFAIAVTSLVLLLSALLPALRATRVDLNDTLSRAAARSSAARSSLRVQDALLVGQIGLSVVLLSGAALMLSTLLRLHSESMGFRTNGIASMRIALAPGEHEDATRRNRIYDALVSQIAQLPGVERAGLSSSGPLSGGYGVRFTVDGDASTSPRRADRAIVTPDYFQALSIPLLSGRGLSAQDHDRSAPVVVINDALARSAFSDTSPLGRRIRTGEESQWRTVVGIVGNTRSTFYNTLEWRTEPFMYVPHRQSMTTGFGPVSQDVWAYVRATGPLPLGDVRRAVSRVSASAAVAEYDDLGAVVAKATRQVRLRAGLLAAFSAVALCLAAVGIYGVTLQSVVQRTKEIGIRIALGAVTRQINMMVLSRGLTLAVTGFALGIAGSAALAQALSGLLYGVRPTDPLVFALVGVVLLSVAGLAAYLPARRASRVSPTVVLRYE